VFETCPQLPVCFHLCHIVIFNPRTLRAFFIYVPSPRMTFVLRLRDSFYHLASVSFFTQTIPSSDFLKVTDSATSPTATRFGEAEPSPLTEPRAHIAV